jgi:hypothetical protein
MSTATIMPTTQSTAQSTAQSTHLQFPGIPPALLADLALELNNTQNPLSGSESVEVFRHTDGLVFWLNEGSFSFCRNRGGQSDVECFRDFLRDSAQTRYMTVTYELMSDDPSIVQQVIGNYKERYTLKHAEKIDSILVTKAQIPHLQHSVLLVRIPKELVYETMSHVGGQFVTVVKGVAGTMRAIPALTNLVEEDVPAGDTIRRMLVTEYKRGDREVSRALHWSIVKNIMEDHKGCGITIGPVATWMP